MKGNPLEKPWSLTAEEFTRRAKSMARLISPNLSPYETAHEETATITEEIIKVEAEIDERVKKLYGV